jgi:hypothetical protein
MLVESYQFGAACARFMLYEILLHGKAKTEEINEMMK